MLLSEADSRVEMTKEEREFISALFSDETETYRSPAEPDSGEPLRIRLRTEKSSDCRVWLLMQDRADTIPMNIIREDEYFSWFEAELVCPNKPVSYCFLVEHGGKGYLCKRFDAGLMNSNRTIDFTHGFRITPGFHTPAWARGALQYQIFVDRFRNGCHDNDPLTGEYCYEGDPVRQKKNWDETPDTDDYRCFYGGDLQGVMEKLDYLQSLGVDAIYFNPLFLSPSSHKYDTQDYEHIDPHFAVIKENSGGELCEQKSNPIEMKRYISRVTDPENLEESNALFARLCQEMHKRGMRVIIDGVFNHCGSFHRWMDGKGIYLQSDELGAWQSHESPYRSYFHFNEKNDNTYEAWWGHPTLPKLNYENSPELCEQIFEVACLWAQPPYSIDGWRLDMAADLGHSPEFNHKFWREFRRRVKAVNPDVLIIAEYYGDASSWLQGDQWDTVMNYDAFMEPVSFFLTGMEKHSDYFHDGLYQDGVRFFRTMSEAMSRMDWGTLQCAMNELSNHDHSRFLTRTNRTAGRVNTMGAHEADKNIDKRILREAIVIQMSWPGAPTIYYGDEAGVTGWTDPDNRRTYPWGREDQDLIEMHRRLAALRRKYPVLCSGSYKALDAGRGWIAYARFNETECAVTVCNNSDDSVLIPLRVRDAGVPEDEPFEIAFFTEKDCWDDTPKFAGKVKNGYLHILVPAHSAGILVRGIQKTDPSDEKSASDKISAEMAL